MLHMPTKDEITAMPTIHVGQFDDLKFEDSETRIWVSRVEEMPDGTAQVTVEKLSDGTWLPDEIF